MPREITILSSRPHDLAGLARAAEGVADATEVREIDGGEALQVLDSSGTALVTVWTSRMLATDGEIERLLVDAPTVALPTWWSDAVAPLDDDGEAGVSIALRLALALDAVCLIDD